MVFFNHAVGELLASRGKVSLSEIVALQFFMTSNVWVLEYREG